MDSDKMLKRLTVRELSDDMGLIKDILQDYSENKLRDERFYTGDGLDYIRLILKHFNGIYIDPWRAELWRKLKIGYMRELIQDGKLMLEIIKELDISEATYYRYLGIIRGMID